MIAMLMHRLNLILNFKVVVFSKNQSLKLSCYLKKNQGRFEFLILPPCDNITMHKILQLGFHVLNKLHGDCKLVHELQLLLFTFLG
jgi:hypothetical protein